LPARRPVREAPQADGGVGGVLRQAAERRRSRGNPGTASMSGFQLCRHFDEASLYVGVTGNRRGRLEVPNGDNGTSAKDDTAPSRQEDTSGSRIRKLHATAALTECLLSIINDEDDPELDAVDNKRRRNSKLLWVISRCFENSELKTYIATLGVKFEDL